jgi:Skp family chaperone for outer membrane proteins
MKTRVLAITLLLCLGVVPAGLLAQAAGKVGIVDMQGAMVSTAEGKKAMADLQKKYQPRQLDVQRLQQEIQSLNDQLQRQAATLSEEEQRKLSRNLEEKQKVLKRTTEDASADFGVDRDEMLRRIGQKMVKVIQDYAQKNGFSLVLGSDQVPVYYADKEVDLTAEIIRLYDTANPVADAAPAGKPATTHPATPAAKPKQ